jgi:polar amino acid transport system substrate-binding protein
VKRTAAIVALTSSLALLTACGGNTDAADQKAANATVKGTKINLGPNQNRVRGTKDAAIAAEVPSKISKTGTLVIGGTAGTAPPLGFYATDDKTPIGVEYDLATLVADTLGLKPTFNVTSWENLFIGLDSGKNDVGFSNVTVTEERKEKYDFATYRLDNLAFEAKKSVDWKVTGPKDVAGKTIAVSSGTNQEKILLEWSQEDKKNGLKPVDVKYYNNASDYYLALDSGRIDAYLGPNPTAAYHVAVSGKTKIVGTYSGGGATIQGKIAAITKKDNGLVKALNDALNKVIKDGSYAKVLKRWGLSNEAVTTSELNPVGLPKTSS